jgi:hypothetical protein
MKHTLNYYDLRDALAEPGCPVCSLKARSAERFLDGLLWGNVNDIDLRAELREARGLCHEHSWGLLRHGASLGIAIITQDVLKNLLRGMENAEFQGPSGLSLRRVQETLRPRSATMATAELVKHLSPRRECPACVRTDKIEKGYLETLVDSFAEPDGLLGAYESSDGLCLPHFRQALTLVRKPEVFSAFVGAQVAFWEVLRDQLGEVIRKNDYRFSDEEWGEEANAWHRALTALAGNQLLVDSE